MDASPFRTPPRALFGVDLLAMGGRGPRARPHSPVHAQTRTATQHPAGSSSARGPWTTPTSRDGFGA